MSTFQATLQRADRTNAPNKKHPECHNVSQKETLGGKCRECDRTFRGRSDLKQRHQYICADLRRSMPGQSDPNETDREEAGPEGRKQHGSRETANPGQEDEAEKNDEEQRDEGGQYNKHRWGNYNRTAGK